MIEREIRRARALVGASIVALAGAACSDTNRARSSTGEADGGGPELDPACTPTRDAGSSPLPTDVFCTGLYLKRDPARHVPSAVAYTPGVVFWSDGAEKQRYLYLPPPTSAASKIDTSKMDAWKFPAGTKAWKEFRLGGKLVETRLLWKRDDANWETATYIWNDAQTEATLNTSRQPVVLADGYEIPTAKDCGKCHHGASDKLLGVEAVLTALPTAEGVTLQTLVDAGALSAPPDRTSITLPEDATGKAGAALGFLHVNCGVPCHSSRGLGEETQLLLRLHADEFWPGSSGVEDVTRTDAYTASVNQVPTTAAVAQKFPGALRITPGAHDASLLWLLSHRRGDYQMPPLVSHKIDEASSQQLADWIDALK
jgi:hypothetical protein